MSAGDHPIGQESASVLGSERTREATEDGSLSGEDPIRLAADEATAHFLKKEQQQRTLRQLRGER
jgi:hypothetical protein